MVIVSPFHNIISCLVLQLYSDQLKKFFVITFLGVNLINTDNKPR